MLNGIPSILTGRVLAALDGMGHSDMVVIADAHFPASRLGAEVVELPGVTTPQAVRALQAVLPLDTGPDPAPRLTLMASADGRRQPVQRQLAQALDLEPDAGAPDVLELDRAAFYTEAGAAQLILRTGELRAYGNALLRKGLAEPDESWRGR